MYSYSGMSSSLNRSKVWYSPFVVDGWVKEDSSTHPNITDIGELLYEPYSMVKVHESWSMTHIF